MEGASSEPALEGGVRRCHVGPGAAGFVEAKAAGTRQLWHVIINKVQTPVEAPVRSMPPARETCFGCHSGEGHQGDRAEGDPRICRR